MLTITIPPGEFWDADAQEFTYTKEFNLRLEHSLISISKWESKFKKPFLENTEKSPYEMLEYIKFMSITQSVPEKVYKALTDENIKEIKDYIEDPMTATKFYNEKEKKGPQKTITSEIIYYWMVALAIPFECQKWHLNRLLTLIRVVNKRQSPKKKMSKKEIMRRNRELNEKRKKKLNTRG